MTAFAADFSTAFGPPPPDIAYGQVVGRFVTFVTDSIGDPDTAPDEVPLNGTVILTPRTHILQLPSAAPPRLAVAQQVTARVISGDLCSPDSIDPGIWLLATDQPNGQPATIQWRASFRLTGVTSQPGDVIFEVPAGGTVDLSQIVSLPPEPSTVVVVSHTDALDSAANAAAAATGAADALASAQSAAVDADDAEAWAAIAGQDMDAAALSASQAAASAVVAANNATAASTSAGQAATSATDAGAAAAAAEAASGTLLTADPAHPGLYLMTEAGP